MTDNDTPHDGDKPDEQDTAANPEQTGGGSDMENTEPQENGGEASSTPWADGEVAELKADVAELKDRLLRTLAETENVRRRSERERDDARKYAVTAFARDVIAVGDNLARALQSVGAEARDAADDAMKNLIDGVEMTQREMLNVFERHGINRLSPQGEKFDPNFHQAMFEVENVEVPNGTVLEVMQEGYVIGERVLRPAMVGVSKGGPKESRRDVPGAAASESSSSNDNEPGAADDPAIPGDDTASAQTAARSHEEAASAKEGEAAGKTVDRNA